MSVEIVLITGPAGVGKSTLCWEIGAELAAAGNAHAINEADEQELARIVLRAVGWLPS